jgi:hypothetical protein
MAPDFERLARMPWPIASLASSGISLIVAHDDPRVRAANETASIGVTFAHVQFHNFLLRPN